MTGSPACATSWPRSPTAGSTGDRLRELVELQEAAVKQAANAPKLSAMDASRRRGRTQRLARGTRRTPTLGHQRRPWSPAEVRVPWLDTLTSRRRPGQPGTRRSMAHLHRGNRTADGRDRGFGHPHLRIGRRGQGRTRKLDRSPFQTGGRARSCSTPRWSCCSRKVPAGVQVVKEYDHVVAGDSRLRR